MESTRSTNADVVAGDFLSLLGRHALAPMVAAGDGVKVGRTDATTVFAFHFREGVLVAGDRRATAGNVVVTDDVEKVVELDARSILAIAGVPAMAFEMIRVLQSSFEYYRRSQLQALSLPAKVRALARLLRENLPMALQGVGIVVPLFAGVDDLAPETRPQIFFYDPLGAQFLAARHAASGSGSGTIRSILSYAERFGSPRPSAMGLEEALVFALRLLVVAAEFDTATAGVDPEVGRFATIKVLSGRGIETISEGRQAEAMKG